MFDNSDSNVYRRKTFHTQTHTCPVCIVSHLNRNVIQKQNKNKKIQNINSQDDVLTKCLCVWEKRFGFDSFVAKNGPSFHSIRWKTKRKIRRKMDFLWSIGFHKSHTSDLIHRKRERGKKIKTFYVSCHIFRRFSTLDRGPLCPNNIYI